MKPLLVIFIYVFVCSEAQLLGLQYPVTRAPLLGTTSKDQRECVWRCPKTSQYDPICGTNGVRYYNIGYLTCAHHCGIDVQPSHPPPCTGFTSTTVIPRPLPPQGRR